MGRLFLMVLAVSSLSGCGNVEDTQEYQTGYEDGHEVGFEEGSEAGRQEICDEVESRLSYDAANEVGC